ncbi:hypothetical protein BOVMAS33_14130 [Streptococcus uberis]|nr:hypothetical protein AF69_09265 [Streptococcus uberis 6736]
MGGQNQYFLTPKALFLRKSMLKGKSNGSLYGKIGSKYAHVRKKYVTF